MSVPEWLYGNEMIVLCHFRYRELTSCLPRKYPGLYVGNFLGPVLTSIPKWVVSRSLNISNRVALLCLRALNFDSSNSYCDGSASRWIWEKTARPPLSGRFASSILGVCQVSSVPRTFTWNVCDFPDLSRTSADTGVCGAVVLQIFIVYEVNTFF